MAYNVAIMGNPQREEVDHDAIMKMLNEREERREIAREKRREMAALKKEREKYKVDIFPIIRSGDCDKLESLLKDCYEKFGDDISDIVNVNEPRWSGWTPMHRAAELGMIDMIEILIEYGGKLDTKTIYGWHTPMHLALGNGWRDCARYLYEVGAAPFKKNKSLQTPCAYAISKGYETLGREFEEFLKNKEAAAKLKKFKETFS